MRASEELEPEERLSVASLESPNCHVSEDGVITWTLPTKSIQDQAATIRNARTRAFSSFASQESHGKSSVDTLQFAKHASCDIAESPAVAATSTLDYDHSLEQNLAQKQRQQRRKAKKDFKSQLRQQQIQVIVLTLVLFAGIIVLGGLSVTLYILKSPDLSEGTFGHATPVNRSQTIAFGQFVEARRMAVAATQVPSTVGGLDGYYWRRIVLIYHAQFGEVVSPKGLKTVQEIESSLRDLPGWKTLCSTKVPEHLRQLCLAGDSLASSIFGSTNEVDAEESGKGITRNISFDGRGTAQLVGLDTLLAHTARSSESTLRRWLSMDGGRRVCRSTFAFFLPANVAAESWVSLVQNEIEPLLNARGEEESENEVPIEEMEEGDISHVNVFITADNVPGMRRREFTHATGGEFPKLVLCPLATLIGTMIATQRLLLSLVAAFVAIVAPLASTMSIISAARDGTYELPILAMATWFMISVACAEMASSCARVSEVPAEEEEQERKALLAVGPQEVADLEDEFAKDRRNRVAKRVLAFVWHATSPQIATGGVAVGLSLWVSDLQMLAEFCLHFGVGLVFAGLFSALLCPTAAALGDALLKYQQEPVDSQAAAGQTNGDLMIEVPTGDPVIYMLTQAVFGDSASAQKDLKRKMETKLMSSVKGILSSAPVRLFLAGTACMLLLLVVVTEPWPRLLVTTPPLFEAGHTIREGKKAQTMFTALPAPKAMLGSDSFLYCTADADADAGCSMHSCQTTARQHEFDTCTCYLADFDPQEREEEFLNPFDGFSLSVRSGSEAAAAAEGPLSRAEGGECYGAAARLWGLSPLALQQSYVEYFWGWAAAKLGDRDISITGAERNGEVCSGCASEPERMSLMQMSDWSTGGLFDMEGVSTSFSDSAAVGEKPFPEMESACLNIACFCGAIRCSLGAEGQNFMHEEWESLCEAEECFGDLQTPEGLAASAKRRRLQEEEGGQEASAASRSEPRQQTPKPWSVDAASVTDYERGTIDVTVVFGLSQPDAPPRTASAELPPLQESFEIEDVWAQRSVLAFCEATAPGLRIVSTSCWAIDFRNWLASRGEHYPVSPDRFYERFALFAKEAEDRAEGSEEDTTQDGTFWIDQDGRIRGFFAVFTITTPEPEEEMEISARWNDYVALRNNVSSTTTGQAWLVMPFSVEQEQYDAIEGGAVSTIVLSSVLAGVAALVLTLSIRLAAAVTLALLMAVCFLGVLTTGLIGRTGGVIEIVAMATFVCSVTAPLLRVASRYAITTDGPGVHPEKRAKVKAHKMRSMAAGGGARAHAELQAQLQKLDDQPPFWAGATSSERLARAASTVVMEVAVVFGSTSAAVFAGPTLLFTNLEALGQIGLALLCGYVTALPIAVGLLPILFAAGLAPSRVRSTALAAFRKWFAEGRPVPLPHGAHLGSAGPHEDSEEAIMNSVAEDGIAAARILGWPFTFFVGNLQATNRQATFNMSMEEIESEEGTKVLGLDLHGATAMPPYHVAMEVRDNIRNMG